MARVELSHEEHGPLDGRPVVLLHGFPLSRGMWSEQIEPLRRAGYRLILPDLRGHGESPVGKGPATMEASAKDVENLLDDLGVDRFVLGGFSLGGYVALELARRNRDRIDGLLLVDTRAEPDTQEARKKRHETAEAVRREGLVVLERAMLPKLLTEATRRKKLKLTAKVRRMIHATPAEGAAAALEGMAKRPDQRPQLAKFTMPVLVVVGERDELTPPDSSRSMASALPDAKLVIVPNVAHLVPLEAAKTFNAELKRWLDARFPVAPSGRARNTSSRTRSARSPTRRRRQRPAYPTPE